MAPGVSDICLTSQHPRWLCVKQTEDQHTACKTNWKFEKGSAIQLVLNNLVLLNHVTEHLLLQVWLSCFYSLDLVILWYCVKKP